MNVSEIGEVCGIYGEEANGIPEGERPVDRPRRRWQDGIKMYLRNTMVVCRIHLAQNIEKRWPLYKRGNNSSGSIKCL
jgi:hypothetical protein